jgi:uncharacterized glyoxalase superfamily protein PhnB
MKMQRLTPVLPVESIEPVLEFWVDRLGFTKAMVMPEQGKLDFVILERDEVQIMYQTRSSIAADVPAAAQAPLRGTFLYIEVDDLDSVVKALKSVTPVMPRRKTFYGADELIVREPAGNTVTFAQFAPKS